MVSVTTEPSGEYRPKAMIRHYSAGFPAEFLLSLPSGSAMGFAETKPVLSMDMSPGELQCSFQPDRFRSKKIGKTVHGQDFLVAEKVIDGYLLINHGVHIDRDAFYPSPDGGYKIEQTDTRSVG